MGRQRGVIAGAGLALVVLLAGCDDGEEDAARAGIGEARLLVNGLHDEDDEEIVGWINRVCDAFDEHGLTDGYAELAAENVRAGGRGVDLDALVDVAVRYECPEYGVNATP